MKFVGAKTVTRRVVRRSLACLKVNK